jgi:hypothetical protein
VLVALTTQEGWDLELILDLLIGEQIVSGLRALFATRRRLRRGTLHLRTVGCRFDTPFGLAVMTAPKQTPL